MPKGQTKKKSLLEAAEAKAGLIVRQYSAELVSGKRKDERLAWQAGTGRITLKATQYLEDDQLALCVAMHTYMGLLSKIAGPHFDWNEASQCAEVSELGNRLLLCADLLDEYLVRKIPFGWNDEGAYIHSAYVELFRATLAVVIDRIRTRQGMQFVDCRLLIPEDIALLQRALKTVLRWMARPHSCAANRRLYVEMLKTRRSIEEYVAKFESKISQAVTVLVKIDVVSGCDYSGKGRGIGEAMDDVPGQRCVDFFKKAAAYTTLLQRTWPEAVIGYLAKVTRSNQGDPQCVMLFFLQPETGRFSWKTKLDALAADFNQQRPGKALAPCRVNVIDVDPTILKQPRTHVRQLIEDLFVRELRYRRLNLPARRRSMSKGVV